MRLTRTALAAAIPLLTLPLALAACGGATDDTNDPMDLPTVEEGSAQTGVTQSELATNAVISQLGIDARKLATETPFEEQSAIVADMQRCCRIAAMRWTPACANSWRRSAIGCRCDRGGRRSGSGSCRRRRSSKGCEAPPRRVVGARRMWLRKIREAVLPTPLR